ncbi:chaplin [Streptomyces sp. NPDC005492]|uniref:chaplin n=1 Tax=Streptomyces sp. NPDC005492 TaxID=3156883 RepID=UPI0033A42198
MRQVTRKSLMTVAVATGVIAAAGGVAHADSGARGSSADSPGVLSGNTVQAPVHVPVNVCGNTVNVVGVLNPAVGNKCGNQGGGSGGGYGDSGGYGSSGGHGAHGGSGGSHAGGHASGSPGVGSGNHVQVPIDAPVNVCGNSVDVIGIGNPATGNDCANGGSWNGGGHDHGTPPGGGGHHGGGGGHHGGHHHGGGGHDGTSPGGGHGTTPPGTPGTPTHPVTPGHPASPITSPIKGGYTPTGSAYVNQAGAHSAVQTQGAAQLAHTGSDLPLGLALPVGAGALLAGAVLYRKAKASV